MLRQQVKSLYQLLGSKAEYSKPTKGWVNISPSLPHCACCPSMFNIMWSVLSRTFSVSSKRELDMYRVFLCDRPTMKHMLYNNQMYQACKGMHNVKHVCIDSTHALCSQKRLRVRQEQRGGGPPLEDCHAVNCSNSGQTSAGRDSISQDKLDPRPLTSLLILGMYSAW